jgi:hypothetical protein
MLHNVLTPINWFLVYFMMGLLWGMFIEHMDKKTGKNKLPRTFTATIVIVMTWPFMLILFIVTFIKNLIK